MKRNLVIGVGWSLVLFGVVNALDFIRRPACRDCNFPRGVPFTMYYDATVPVADGFGYFTWVGVMADFAFAVMNGVVLAWIVWAFANTTPKAK